MSISIKPILHPEANKDGLQKIMLQVLYDRMKVCAKTDYRVHKDQWNGGKVINHPLDKKINSNLSKQSVELESKILDFLRNDKLSKDQLKAIIKGELVQAIDFKETVTQLIEDLKGKLSVGRLKHYRSVLTKIIACDPSVTFNSISLAWMAKFEKYIRGTGLANNTLFTNINICKAILTRCVEDGYLKPEQFAKYKRPKWEQGIPEYITEAEMVKIFNLVKSVEREGHRLAGLYFLLSCYAGYRISDLKRFDYNKMVKGDKIVLRTQKNGAIVSMAIHSRLQAILDLIKETPLTLSEQNMRLYVKEISGLVGINRDIKVHTGRHSFAMMLMANGFNQAEAAKLLGDTVEVARIYARIQDSVMNDLVMKRLG